MGHSLVLGRECRSASAALLSLQVHAANIEFRVPYSQRYLFNAVSDTNHNANPNNPNRNSTGKVTLTLLTLILGNIVGYPAEVGALFTTVSSIRVSRVSKVSRVRVTLTVTVRVSRVSVMVSVRDSVK